MFPRWPNLKWFQTWAHPLMWVFEQKTDWLLRAVYAAVVLSKNDTNRDSSCTCIGCYLSVSSACLFCLSVRLSVSSACLFCLSVRMSVSSVSPSVYFAYQSVFSISLFCPHIHLFVSLFLSHQFVCLTYPSMFSLSACFICHSVCLFHLSVCFSIRLFFHLSICLSVCFFCFNNLFIKYICQCIFFLLSV